jgi:hypothetical protein
MNFTWEKMKMKDISGFMKKAGQTMTIIYVNIKLWFKDIF